MGYDGIVSDDLMRRQRLFCGIALIVDPLDHFPETGSDTDKLDIE
jgi:hypothetical protein